MNPSICPHCQQVLPENHNASYCPHCGGAVQPAEPRFVEARLQPVKISWLIIFGALLAPPLLTLLVAFLGKGQSNDQVSPIVGVFGGGVGGLAFGIMLALRVSKTIPLRVILSIVFSVVFVVVGITLSCFGCLAGGYHFRID